MRKDQNDAEARPTSRRHAAASPGGGATTGARTTADELNAINACKSYLTTCAAAMGMIDPGCSGLVAGAGGCAGSGCRCIADKSPTGNACS